jgi:hypothetical protein
MNFFIQLQESKPIKFTVFRKTYPIVYNKSTTPFGPSWTIIITTDNRSKGAETCRKLVTDNYEFIDKHFLLYKSQQDTHVTEFILSDNCFGRYYATHSTLKPVPTLPR